LSSPAQNPLQAFSPDPAAPSAAQDNAFHAAPLPWRGLDGGWRGSRRRGLISVGPDGTVAYGTLAHGDAPARRPGGDPQRRAVTVVTMMAQPRRPLTKADGTPAGFVEETTVSTAAAVAGMSLVDEQWPWEVDAAVRQSWMDQQRELAASVADRLGTPPWRSLTLDVDNSPVVFHYRESEYGWVLATELPDCLLSAFGRGVSAYSLAFTHADLDHYVA
jgi:hypothetical protein